MFHRKRLDRGTNALDGRALRIKYRNKTSSFNTPLVMDNAVSIHHEDLQAQATEIHKIQYNNIIITTFLH